MRLLRSLIEVENTTSPRAFALESKELAGACPRAASPELALEALLEAHALRELDEVPVFRFLIVLQLILFAGHAFVVDCPAIQAVVHLA